MRPFRSRSTSAPSRGLTSVVAAAIACLLVRDARAQACCAGASAVAPARLAPHEDGLVGAQLKLSHAIGSWGPDGRYSANPGGSSENALEEDLFATIRIARVVQLTLLAPVLETRRAAGGVVGVGGGLGDVALSARIELTRTGASVRWPGIALVGSASAPTGRAVEDATAKLAADATGIGAWQGGVGVSIEQLFGDWFVALNASVSTRTSRTISHESSGGVATTTSSLAPRWTTSLAVAWTVRGETAISATASVSGEGDATTDGVKQSGTSRRTAALTLGAVTPIDDRWRLQGSVTINPPASTFGENETTSLAAALVVVRSWS